VSPFFGGNAIKSARRRILEKANQRNTIREAIEKMKKNAGIAERIKARMEEREGIIQGHKGIATDKNARVVEALNAVITLQEKIEAMKEAIWAESPYGFHDNTSKHARKINNVVPASETLEWTQEELEESRNTLEEVIGLQDADLTAITEVIAICEEQIGIKDTWIAIEKIGEALVSIVKEHTPEEIAEMFRNLLTKETATEKTETEPEKKTGKD
jgi:hypothetical protein